MDVSRGLADATCVQSARADLLSLLETWRRHPLHERVVSLVKQRTEESYPATAAARARLQFDRADHEGEERDADQFGGVRFGGLGPTEGPAR